MGRTLALLGTLALVLLLAALTVAELVNNGLNGRVVISALILALLGFGVVGALMTPPEE